MACGYTRPCRQGHLSVPIKNQDSVFKPAESLVSRTVISCCNEYKAIIINTLFFLSYLKFPSKPASYIFARIIHPSTWFLVTHQVTHSELNWFFSLTSYSHRPKIIVGFLMVLSSTVLKVHTALSVNRVVKCIEMEKTLIMELNSNVLRKH